MSVKGVCQWGVSGMCQRCVRGVSEGIIEDMIWYDTRIGGWRNVPLSYQHMKFLLDNHRIVQICIDIHVKRVSGGQGQRGDRKLKFAPRHFQKELHVGLDGAVVGDLQSAGGVHETVDVAPPDLGLIQHYFRPRACARDERLYRGFHTARDGDEDGDLELSELFGGHADDDLDRAILFHKPYGSDRGGGGGGETEGGGDKEGGDRGGR